MRPMRGMRIIGASQTRRNSLPRSVQARFILRRFRSYRKYSVVNQPWLPSICTGRISTEKKNTHLAIPEIINGDLFPKLEKYLRTIADHGYHVPLTSTVPPVISALP